MSIISLNISIFKMFNLIRSEIKNVLLNLHNVNVYVLLFVCMFEYDLYF